MNNKLNICMAILVSALCLSITGCVSIPKGFLKLSENSLENRQFQIRQYETKDETLIMQSTAGVLQDLGFTLDSSETDLGFVAASKKADATNTGQVLLLAFFGGAQAVQQADASQVVKGSVITRPSVDENKIVVRVTFQRVVWNQAGQISRVESINDVEIYQSFYQNLSKAIFLEAHEI